MCPWCPPPVSTPMLRKQSMNHVYDVIPHNQLAKEGLQMRMESNSKSIIKAKHFELLCTCTTPVCKAAKAVMKMRVCGKIEETWLLRKGLCLKTCSTSTHGSNLSMCKAGQTPHLAQV